MELNTILKEYKACVKHTHESLLPKCSVDSVTATIQWAKMGGFNSHEVELLIIGGFYNIFVNGLKKDKCYAIHHIRITNSKITCHFDSIVGAFKKLEQLAHIRITQNYSIENLTEVTNTTIRNLNSLWIAPTCVINHTKIWNSQLSFTVLPVFNKCRFENCKFGSNTDGCNTLQKSKAFLRNNWFSVSTIANNACPESGEFTAYKKLSNNRIAKLLIPADAKRSSAFTLKCRASRAQVLDISSIDNKTKYKEGYSMHHGKFVYRIGHYVEPEQPFDNNPLDECAPGIHFFMTRKAAVDYNA